MTRAESVQTKYIETFGASPEHVIAAPGRVNLIGEHTDYNDGFVLPVALDYSVIIACSPRVDDRVNAYSMNFGTTASFSLEKIEKDPKSSWCDYIKGVARMLLDKRIELAGADMVLEGNVPQGSGLSSSAALEVATAYALQAMNGFPMSGPEMALLSQAAENKFVGVNCGIMDQFISRLGVKDHALFIDCRTLEYEPVPIPMQGVRFVIVDSRKKRGLVDSEYNTRRTQCEEAVSILSEYLPGIKALRDVSVEDFRRFGGNLPAETAKRAEHVIGENDRVLRSVRALTNGDLGLFGRLMNESHDSLRDLFEVSCRELNTIVDAARGVPGVYGSRMTGAGFGGCTVSLVAKDAVEEFAARVPKEYEARTGITPTVYICSAENGAGKVSQTP
ncbi:MAG: galactokinase [Armatimonadota bacterium]